MKLDSLSFDLFSISNLYIPLRCPSPSLSPSYCVVAVFQGQAIDLKNPVGRRRGGGATGDRAATSAAMGRAPCCDKANVKKGPWSPEEDKQLKEYMEKHGTGGNWIALPQKAGNPKEFCGFDSLFVFVCALPGVFEEFWGLKWTANRSEEVWEELQAEMAQLFEA